ncbi:hypothetical protein ACET3Z_022546 [Daucus carota]
MEAPRTVMELVTTLGTRIASFMFVWAIIRQYVPVELRRNLESYTHRLLDYFYPYIRISIHEFTGSHLKRSEAYSSVEAYLSANSTKNAKRLKAEVGRDSNKVSLSMDEHERVADEFNGVQVWWLSSKVMSVSRAMSDYPEPEKRFYRLKFHKKHREMITETYLEHVLNKGKEIKRQNKQRRLYTNNSGSSIKYSGRRQWSHIVFEHPATFETLAMEPGKKQEIIEDLSTFSKSKDYYARIGKAWKRGYLLYGPPGTGKSTMIAAMANFLSYDIYDLELTAVKDNTELRMLLIGTTSKSIIVIEDIDCSLELTGQRKKKEEKPDKGKKEAGKEPKDEGGSKVTLSGLLNFIDGLWSASGGERIIVFTTNYVEKLDPALTRRGRMDKHVEMSYCSFEGFKVLAKNYLEVEDHPAFDSIQQLMTEALVTPADVAENLMHKTTTENADVCLSNLIRALNEAKDLKKNELEKLEAMSSDKQKEPVEVEAMLLDQPREPVEVEEMLPNKQAAEESEAVQVEGMLLDQ